MERDEAGRFVLDRMDTPDGRVALVAFRQDGPRVGVARDSGDLLSSIGVGRGSMPYEPYAWRRWPWGVAFGGVPPKAVRAEVRNDDGEAFPARIVALPAELGTDDQAAWGLVERIEDECPLVSYDEHGDPVTMLGDFAVAPRTVIGEGDDPVGGHWRLWISHWHLGPLLTLRTAYSRGGCGIGQLPAFGFGSGGRGRHRGAGPEAWDVDGLVTAEAERVEVTTRAGVRPATVVRVPSREFGPCKAYVAFLPVDEEPMSVTAFDVDGVAIATSDFIEH
jgi:hypothetical protein